MAGVRTLREDDWAEFHSVARFWPEVRGVRSWWQTTGRNRFGKRSVGLIDRAVAKLAAA